MLPEQLLQYILLQLEILQKENPNPQLCPLSHQSLQIEPGQALAPGLYGEGPGDIQALGSLSISRMRPGPLAAGLGVAHIDSKGLQGLAVTGSQRPVQELIIRAGLIFQHTPA